MSIGLDVDRVVVISVPRRTDRRAIFSLPDRWPWPEPAWSEGVDCREVCLPREWHAAGAPAYACSLSHRQVLEEAMDDGVGSLLVLEDDAIFRKEFHSVLSLFATHVPKDWELLMLGGEHVSEPEDVAPAVLRCWDTQRTHAYIARGGTMKLLHDTWEQNPGHIDRHLRKVQWQAATYAPKVFLVGQRGGWSDVIGYPTREMFWG